PLFRTLYAGIEFEQGQPETLKLIDFLSDLSGKTIREDSGISIKPISVTATKRIVTYAFEYARKYGRKKVTAVHKANIMKFTDGLFLSTAREVAEGYPDIQFEDRILRHRGEEDAADRLEAALAAVIAAGKSVTYDMKPTRDDPTAVGTSQVADAVIEKLRAGAA